MSKTTSSMALGLALCAMTAAAIAGCDDGPTLVTTGSGAGTGAGGAGAGGSGAGGKVTECPAGEADCDTSPDCETKVWDNPAHCGSCGNACSADGYCNKDTCAEPEVLAEAAGTDLTVTAQYVVWTDKMTGELRRVPVVGGKDELLLSGQPAPRSLTTDGKNVYWTSLADAKIRSIAADAAPGTAAAELGAGDGPAQAIACDGTRVFWAEAGNIHAQAMAGGAPEVVVSGDVFVSALALGTSDLYFSSQDDCIHRTTKSGADLAAVATDEAAPWGVVTDETATYWLTTTFPCSVRKRTHTGELSTLVVTDDSCAFGPLTGDEKNVYWPQWDSEEIWQADKSDGTTFRLAGNAGHVRAMAMDATHLYWISSNHGTIMRIARK